MKKLLFVLAFAFIGQQSFSQMYIVTLSHTTASIYHVVCTNYGAVLSIVAPDGTITYRCFSNTNILVNSDVIGVINQELNSIINQGYKLIETNNGQSDKNGFINDQFINYGTTWYLAIP